MRTKRFGVAAIALAAAGALILSGCSTGGGGDEAPKGDTTAIITTNGSEPQNPLIPTNTNEVGGGKILDAIFAGLVYYDAKGAPVNDMAESIESDDAQNYTIKIKPDQKFTNGEPVTAESFVEGLELRRRSRQRAALELLLRGRSRASATTRTSPSSTGLKVVDDTTFTVALNQPESDFPLRLGYSAFYPLPEAAFDGHRRLR